MTEQLRHSYHIDHGRQILWVLHRKNAGTSIREAIGAGPGTDMAAVSAEEALEHNDYHTVTVLRHPWDRVTSGLYNPYGDDGRPFRQRVREEIFEKKSPMEVDYHLWPQWVTLEGFRIDRQLFFETLMKDWMDLQLQYNVPALEHLNPGQPHDWRRPDGEPFDWSPLLTWYGPDFDQNPEWERA